MRCARAARPVSTVPPASGGRSVVVGTAIAANGDEGFVVDGPGRSHDQDDA